MKYITLIICVMLTACSTQPIIKKEIVFVDKPIPFIPSPPALPNFKSQVDSLTLDDQRDPGKVGQAYKSDMYQLRTLYRLQRLIIDQYKTSSQNFEKISDEINKMMNKINEIKGDQ